MILCKATSKFLPGVSNFTEIPHAYEIKTTKTSPKNHLCCQASTVSEVSKFQFSSRKLQ